MSALILIVEDEPNIREVIAYALKGAGYDTLAAADGAEALALFERQPPALVVLDVGLPELDGLEVCRRIRKVADTPILFLSARGDEIDRVLGLELGGDDYVVKPFSPRELTARVRAILKRGAASEDNVEETDKRLHLGALTLDPARFLAKHAGRVVPLTAIEFEIVCALAARPGVVFNRERIMTAAYPGNINVSDRTIDSHIRNIRAKFAAIGCASAIETVHGVGFRIGAFAEGD